MLELRNIVKDYATGDTVVHALRGVSLTFRKSEFVSVLGPSGCGKTTLLNIVGGLDKYTDGDLLINDRSTKEYKAYDWDTYRNRSIGFVFQNYNLIPHLTVLGNVELALTLSGESKTVRRQKAEAALTRVGLAEQLHKRPNQLSGGQMQRVAIARAIVNDPEIILADEPTGALDSVTSVQISDLLKEISRDRLIIMVTHNDRLAERYSTRIVRLHDGEIVGDTHPYEPDEAEKAAAVLEEKKDKGEYIEQEDATRLTADELAKLDKRAKKAYITRQNRRRAERKRAKKKEMRRTSMSFSTALSLSGRNLATKKGRSIMVSIAGSIGIIGIALVLSISNGFTRYIDKMQTDTLAGFPITVSPQAMDVSAMTSQTGGIKNDKVEFPDSGLVNIYENQNTMIHFNNLTAEYVDYVGAMNPDWSKNIQYSHAVNMHVLAKSGDKVTTVKKASEGMMGSTARWQELLENDGFVSEQYDVMAGALPQNQNEIAIVVDKYNRMSLSVATAMGFDYLLDANKQISFEDMIETAPAFKAIVNDNLYPDGTYREPTDAQNAAMFDAEGGAADKNVRLKVVGVLRIKKGTPIDLFNTGIVYHPDLTKALIELNKTSLIVENQREEIAKPLGAGMNLAAGKTFAQQLAEDLGISIGGGSDGGADDGTGGITDDDIKTLTKMLTILQNSSLESLGADMLPSTIYVYPVNFETKALINEYLDAWNDGKATQDKIMYTDASELLASTMGNMVNIISYVLVAFAAVSLIVSSIMIGIITYVSVIERTKEIGVLRSIGARKKDITRVFNAETILIGLAAGVFGVAVSFLLTFPMNWIINAVIAANGASGMVTQNLAVLNPLHALLLICVSVVLTLISGLIPARYAAKKDPVVALRTE